MKQFWILIALPCFLFCMYSEGFGNGEMKPGMEGRKHIDRKSMAPSGCLPAPKWENRSANDKCQVIYKGEKPLAGYIEDGVAYLLDIPLALMTPFVSALSPITDMIDKPYQTRSCIPVKK